MTLLSTIFVFCCLSPILAIVNLITMEMLGIYIGEMTWHCYRLHMKTSHSV